MALLAPLLEKTLPLTARWTASEGQTVAKKPALQLHLPDKLVEVTAIPELGYQDAS
jgi:hypothetical protein